MWWTEGLHNNTSSITSSFQTFSMASLPNGYVSNGTKGFEKMCHLPTRVCRTELWRCSPPAQRWAPPLLRLNSMPEKDTETEERQAQYTHAERHIAVPDRNNTVIITFEGDSKLGLKSVSVHPVQKHWHMSRAMCLYLPFSPARQIKYFIFFYFFGRFS